MDFKNKLVLIACPTLGLDPDPTKWLDSLLKIQNEIRKAGMSQGFLAPYRMQWWPANNEIWNTALEYDFDYILRIDDDIWGVPDDAFKRLLEADKDVIGAAYPMRQYPFSMCALKRTENVSLIEIAKHNLEMTSEVSGEGIIPVDLIGFGMTLIKMDKFKSWERPVYRMPQECPDDTYFAQKCLEAGIQQYVHMDVKIGHREVTPANRIYLFNAYSRLLLQTGQIDKESRQYKEVTELFGEDGMKEPEILKSIKRT